MTDRDLPMIIEAETPPVPEPDHGDLLLSSAGFAHGMSLAQTLSQSRMIPAGFRGKPPDILLAVDLARRMGEHPVAVMQNLHFVGDKPGWSATFLIARAANSGIFAGPLEFDTTGEGPTMAVTCSGVLRGSGKRVSRTVSMAMAKAEGWTRNAKYASIGEQMLSYRSAAFLLRLYAPNIMLGLRTTDELQDIAASNGKPEVGETIERVHIVPEPTPTRTSRRQALPIDAEPTPEHVALAAEVAQGRQEAVEAEAVDPKAEARAAREAEKAREAAEKAARQASHDPSWADNDRAGQKAFFAEMKRRGLNGDIVCDLAETVGPRKRPSAMTALVRAKFLTWLETPTAVAAYDAIVEERGRVDVEPDEVVAETAEVRS